MNPLRLMVLLVPALTLMHTHSSDAVAVMSVDLGSAWMKIGIVKPGVPMEIVLNKESRRKTPLCVYLKNGERLFGENALAMVMKSPEAVVQQVTELVGKAFRSSLVQRHRLHYPQLNVSRSELTGRPLITLPGGEVFTPEEILAMILNHSRSLAQDFAGQAVTGAVISVPPWWGQAERRSVWLSASICRLPLLQIMNANVATAINYAVSLTASLINSSAHNVLFYDAGASGSSASIVTFQTVKTQKDTQPHVTVRGVGYDPTLGGMEMDVRLRSLLSQRFLATATAGGSGGGAGGGGAGGGGDGGGAGDGGGDGGGGGAGGALAVMLAGSARAQSKLLREAERLKVVLSANAEHTAQVGSHSLTHS
uniref:Hypoxia up-regulated protein 1 n=1 Tax=Petromyzon marinus TaxID=7757 RepID=A0AAJ7UHM9_PETMA